MLLVSKIATKQKSRCANFESASSQNSKSSLLGLPWGIVGDTTNHSLNPMFVSMPRPEGHTQEIHFRWLQMMYLACLACATSRLVLLTKTGNFALCYFSVLPGKKFIQGGRVICTLCIIAHHKPTFQSCVLWTKSFQPNNAAPSQNFLTKYEQNWAPI